MITEKNYKEWLEAFPIKPVNAYASALTDYDPADYRMKNTQLRFSESGTILNVRGSLLDILDTVEKTQEFLDAIGGKYEKYGTKKKAWRDDHHVLTAAVGKLQMMLSGEGPKETVTEAEAPLQESTGSDEPNLDDDVPHNALYFGAPGTGKSYAMNRSALYLFGGRMERVTFYADYLHAQFVGSYKPTVNNGNVEYSFQPGPFTRVLVKALNDEGGQAYGLIIEELNRAEAASVFGDLFQLVDRDESGTSQYPVSVSEELKEYLRKALTDSGAKRLGDLVRKAYALEEDVPVESCSAIVIPSNMYIWATMNSADQGVFPLDTAFKRRWSFQYFGIDDNENKLDADIDNTDDWKVFRKALNRKLVAKGVNEDKCMGPFFLNKQELGTSFDEAFKNKVIMYLYEDAARYLRDEFFESGKTLGELFEAWDGDNSNERSNRRKFEAVFGSRVTIGLVDESEESGESDEPHAPETVEAADAAAGTDAAVDQED